MKILTVIGARPQFVKAASVSRQIGAASGLDEVILHTGQHYDANMSAIFFEELEIPPPQYNLGIGGGTHGQNTGRMLEAIEDVLIKELPDWVLVYGDTDSTLAGALAAAKLHIPIAHIEAGLRSYNRVMPEEINRLLTDHLASLLLAPTQTARTNLLSEGIAEANIDQTGDVMYDSALFYGKQAEQKSSILSRLNLVRKAYILATIHRQENADDKERLASIFSAFGASGETVILPLHPRTRRRFSEFELTLPENIRIVDPLGYLDMVMLEKNAKLIATDSGGIQKEAYFFAVPCITLRTETEWIETVESGWNKIVGADRQSIERAITESSTPESFAQPKFYGDGNAAARIIQAIRSFQI